MPDTVKVPLEFPKSFIEALWVDETNASEALKQAAVIDLFRQKRISHRKGAELLGLSYHAFQNLASQHHISSFDYEEGWAERELSTLKSYKASSS